MLVLIQSFCDHLASPSLLVGEFPGCAWAPVCIPLADDDEEEDEEEDEGEEDEEEDDEEGRDNLSVLAFAALSMRAPCTPKETREGLKDWLRLGGVFTLATFG